jgi:hypothetical protein
MKNNLGEIYFSKDVVTVACLVPLFVGERFERF